jgi:hypothetical protein
VDSHAHCGIQDRFPPQSFGDYKNSVAGSDIGGVVFFAPVMEIYDRYDPYFEDDPYWLDRRRSANEYLLGLDSPEFRAIPYLFIWNDFAVDQLAPEHRGIKWHRHASEPKYRYDDPKCALAIEEIRRRNLPVVLEEEFPNTVMFVERLAPGVRTVIPHLGFLNGGYGEIRDAGLWKNVNVYADTSLASRDHILDFIERYGHEKLLFGSDFPFGSPKQELQKILELPIPEGKVKAIVGKNLERLFSECNV